MEELKKEVKTLNIRCMYDHLICTMRVKKGSIIVKTEDEILTRQTVLVAGPNAGVNVGDDIELYVERFPMKQRVADKYVKNGIGADNYERTIPVEIIDEEKYLFISSREIKWVYIDLIKVEEERVRLQGKMDKYLTVNSTEEVEPKYIDNSACKPC